MKPEDLLIWYAYARIVEKIKKPDVIIKTIKHEKKHQKSFSNRNIDKLIDSRKTAKYPDIKPLNKLEKRKFCSEATIDLHGYTREIDHVLDVFCARCITNGIKYVTIITGKGTGIVKQATLHWLQTNSGFIVGFFEIIDSIGESGAIGVSLRFAKGM
jgi:DNA-nicking Smr family endonuclease